MFRRKGVKGKEARFLPPRDYHTAEGGAGHGGTVLVEAVESELHFNFRNQVGFYSLLSGQGHIPLQTHIFRKSGRKAKAFPKIKLRFPQVWSYPGS